MEKDTDKDKPYRPPFWGWLRDHLFAVGIGIMVPTLVPMVVDTLSGPRISVESHESVVDASMARIQQLEAERADLAERIKELAPKDDDYSELMLAYHRLEAKIDSVLKELRAKENAAEWPKNKKRDKSP